jgi:phosphoribosylglycinamide formyltransferase-1
MESVLRYRWSTESMTIGLDVKAEAVVLFAYDFPHRKTYVFLKELKFMGCSEIVVIAAPKIPIAVDREVYFEPFNVGPNAEDTNLICQRLGYPFYKCAHEDIQRIAEIVKNHKARLGVIAGARILPEAVIDLFTDGVINFHPGKLPETSGLDSFFYTIQRGLPAGITAHFIDRRVDAGHQWRFEQLGLGLGDSPGAVVEKLFWLQVSMLRDFMQHWLLGNVTVCEIDRPKKNSPMQVIDKYRCLRHFNTWLANQVHTQKLDGLYNACVNDDVAGLSSGLTAGIDKDSCIHGEWTPLVVAAFNHSPNCIAWLIEHGADVNYSNRRGTTVLMYAKTRYLGQSDASYPVLDILIEGGADVTAQDMMGKTVVDYCKEAGDQSLVNYFIGSQKNSGNKLN